MNFGVPKEVRELENRVGMTPAGAHALTADGHTVYIEHHAGQGAGFSDEDYRQVGGQIVYSAAEAYGRAQVVTKVTRLTENEYALLQPEQTLLSFLHLAVASSDLSEALKEHQITAVAYETMQDQQGRLPVLLPTSQVAGRMAPQIAGQLLDSMNGGRGILLSGIPGVPPAVVVVLGGGVVGTNAARSFLGVGAQVIILDRDYQRLESVDLQFNGCVTTMLATPYNLERTLRFADVIVGAVLIPGQRAPVLITAAMMRQMRPRAAFIDFSIDQGGCAETSRPTNHRHPTYIEESVIHYAVPNVPARVPRTASHALTNAALPFWLEIGQKGVSQALADNSVLRHGLELVNGEVLG